jgi:hypothetical protein
MLSVKGEDSRATNKVPASTLRGYEVDTKVDMTRALEDDVSRCLRKEIRGRTRYEALTARFRRAVDVSSWWTSFGTEQYQIQISCRWTV